MTLNLRRSLVWPATILAGLSLSAYVFVAWPETAAPAPGPQTVRTLASVDAGAEEFFYTDEFFVHEVSPAPLLDAVISAPQTVDAN